MANGNYVSASIPVPDWKILKGKPYVTVSAKGISNGLSNIPNDGADFGPDTPGTQTSGIYEAEEYATSQIYGNVGNDSYEVHLLPGMFLINTTLEILNNISLIGHNAVLVGNVPMNSVIDISNIPASGYFIIKDLTLYTAWANYCIYGNVSPEIAVFGTIENVTLMTYPSGSTTNNYAVSITGIEGIRWINVVHGGATDTSFINLQLTGGSNYFLFCKEFNSAPSENIINGVFNQIIGGTWGGILSIAGVCNMYNLGIFGTLTVNTFSGGNTLINMYGGVIEPQGSNPFLILNSLNSTSQLNFSAVNFVYSSSTLPTGGLVQNNSSVASINFDSACTYSLATGSPLNTIISNGTTAGTVKQTSITCTINYKKVMFYFSGYENDTTTNQTINYIFPFTTIANITSNTTGLTISASTSGITITAPNSTTTYSGIVIVEGY